jgi:hypothetical protein
MHAEVIHLAHLPLKSANLKYAYMPFSSIFLEHSHRPFFLLATPEDTPEHTARLVIPLRAVSHFTTTLSDIDITLPRRLV